MKIVTWNMNFWYIYKKGLKKFENWRKDCITLLHKFNADFLIIQEINPYLLFNIKNNYSDQQIHKIELRNEIIFYHELRNEILKDFEIFSIKDNKFFWGNCIISNKKYSFVENNVKLDENSYYGKSGLMAYNYLGQDNIGLTIINIYNKKNNEFDKYTMLNDIKIDIKAIIDKNINNIIILAGDFNSNENDNKHFFDFLKKDCGLLNFTTNFGTTVNFTNYQDDYIFVNKNINFLKAKVHRLINFSDHYPVEIDII